MQLVKVRKAEEETVVECRIELESKSWRKARMQYRSRMLELSAIE